MTPVAFDFVVAVVYRLDAPGPGSMEGGDVDWFDEYHPDSDAGGYCARCPA